MYGNKKSDNTLNPNYMTTFLKNAQIEEFKQLLNLIDEVYLKIKKPLEILDIGVGDGRIPLMLSKNKFMEKISLFVGIENSLIEFNKATNVMLKSKLNEKVKIAYFNALDLGKKGANKIVNQKYDLIICTYFTPGNFKPDGIRIGTNKGNRIAPYSKDSLDPNKNFIKVFKSAHEMLAFDGKIFLGSIYIDTDENRKRQEEFYKKCGMTVITSENDSFTATKEGFWSQRFTKERLYQYLSWIHKDKIKFIPLDNYNFAQAIIISK